MLTIFYAAMDDLVRRRGREPLPRNPALLGALFGHLVSDPEAAAIVAEDLGIDAGFGIAHRRGDEGYLSFLFVLPEQQSRGLGRSLLRACREAIGQPPRMGTCAEADQPVSTGLYGKDGLIPRLPIYLLTGSLAPEALPPLPSNITASPLRPGDVAPVDEAVLGYQRPRDHERWRADEHVGVRITIDGGRILGYGYVHRSGRVGPVATIDPALLLPLLGRLVGSVQPAGPWQLLAPGPTGPSLAYLLGAGMRFESTPAVYCADHAGPRFDRYLPMSFALL